MSNYCSVIRPKFLHYSSSIAHVLIAQLLVYHIRLYLINETLFLFLFQAIYFSWIYESKRQKLKMPTSHNWVAFIFSCPANR